MSILKIIPLGGLGEIGLNMMVFEYGDTIFLVDSGLMFPEDYMLGVDFVIPNMDYLRQNQSKLAAVVLRPIRICPVSQRFGRGKDSCPEFLLPVK